MVKPLSNSEDTTHIHCHKRSIINIHIDFNDIVTKSNLPLLMDHTNLFMFSSLVLIRTKTKSLMWIATVTQNRTLFFT